MLRVIAGAVVSTLLTLAAVGFARSPLPNVDYFLFLAPGACPAGWTEVTTYDGKFLRFTTNAHGDVTNTGGADNITPAGSNSAPTFTGTPFSSVINHTHTVSVTDPGHSHGMAEGQTDGAGNLADRSNAASAATMVTDSATTGITASTANPAGGVASITPAGSNSAPTFTGTQFDNRPAYVNLILCRAQ